MPEEDMDTLRERVDRLERRFGEFLERPVPQLPADLVRAQIDQLLQRMDNAERREMARAAEDDEREPDELRREAERLRQGAQALEERAAALEEEIMRQAAQAREAERAAIEERVRQAIRAASRQEMEHEEEMNRQRLLEEMREGRREGEPHDHFIARLRVGNERIRAYQQRREERANPHRQHADAGAEQARQQGFEDALRIIELRNETGRRIRQPEEADQARIVARPLTPPPPPPMFPIDLEAARLRADNIGRVVRRPENDQEREERFAFYQMVRASMNVDGIAGGTAELRAARIAEERAANEDPANQSLRYSRECTICTTSNPMRRAVLVACGHVMCSPCAEHAQGSADRLTCPFCRKLTTFVKIFENHEGDDGQSQPKRRRMDDDDDDYNNPEDSSMNDHVQ